MPDPRRKNLIAGLVGDRDHLYQTNAYFYHSVNALADMLPYWIDGFAVQAEEMEEEMERYRQTIKKWDEPLSMPTIR